jgi:AraC-like DNA-binding protein
LQRCDDWRESFFIAGGNLHYHQFQPHPILSQFVQCYWAIGADSRTLPAPEHGVIPCGYVDIVFNVGDQVCLSDTGSVFFDQARSFLAGPFDRYQRFSAKGKFEFLGARFQPGGTPFFSSLRLRELRNRAVPLDAVWDHGGLKAELKTLETRLSRMNETTQKVACVEQFLMKFVQHWKEPDAVVTEALSLIEESKGRISIEGLASSMRISARQIERKFAQRVGLSPKAFCRVTRFHQVKSLFENGRESSGCDLAYACGYYDQTHLIQEFRLFTGHTPARYERVQPVGFFLYDAQPNC